MVIACEIRQLYRHSGQHPRPARIIREMENFKTNDATSSLMTPLSDKICENNVVSCGLVHMS